MTRALVLGAALVAAACQSRAQPSTVERASFGVLFGGQVQERERVPFELDKAKQQLVLRVELAAPARDDTIVRWELDLPGTSARVRDLEGRVGGGRIVRLGEGRIARGQRMLDEKVELRPGDPLGLWNVRAIVAGELVLDRAFEVYSGG